MNDATQATNQVLIYNQLYIFVILSIVSNPCDVQTYPPKLLIQSEFINMEFYTLVLVHTLVPYCNVFLLVHLGGINL